MNKITITAALLTLAANTAFAGSPEPAQIIQPIPVAQATVTDWSGFYAGGLYAAFNGDQVYSYGNEFELVGDTYGAFAGYNFQRGAMVYGGELAYSAGSVEDEAFPEYNFNQFIDAKARVGYAFGDALVYGTLGWTFGTWNEDTFSAPTDGMNAGIGIDYLITDSIFIGGEYVYRQQSGEWSANPNNTHDVDLNSLQLRVGMTF